MAAMAAGELEDGMYVNLGIGIPTLVANYVGDKDITLQSENGMSGMGPFPYEDEEDPDLIGTLASRRSPNWHQHRFLQRHALGMIRGGNTPRLECWARWRSPRMAPRQCG